jgi:hypothetical protein
MLIMTNLELPLYTVLYLQYDYIHILLSCAQLCGYSQILCRCCYQNSRLFFDYNLLCVFWYWCLCTFPDHNLTDSDPERCVEKYDSNRFKCT